MVDIQYLIRKSFYESLNGNLSYSSADVPVFDEVSDGSSDLYVILSTQDASEKSTFSHFSHDAFILLDIVHKTTYSSTKDAIDTVAGQILDILKPTPSSVGLVQQTGIQIMSLKIQSDRHLSFTLSDAETINRRLIRAQLIIHES